MSRTGAAWFTAATTMVVGNLPFGVSRVVAPSLLGFAVINGCTFILDLALLTVFHGALHWPVPVSITLSYGAATSISYLLNRTLNFRSHGLVGRQVTIYVGVVVVNYLAFILGVGSGLAAWGLEYQLARIVAGLCEAIWMYVAMRFLVFRDSRDLAQTGPAKRGGQQADQNFVTPDPR